MTPRRLIASFCLTLLAACAFTAAPVAARSPEEVPLLVWKVTAPDQEDADYLLGTMHVPLIGDERLPDKVKALIKGSSTFVMEADIDEKAAPILMRYARQPAGQKLQKQLPAPVWKKLAAAKPAGLQPDQLNQMKAWFVAMAFTWPERGKGPALDQLLQQHAERSGLAVEFLETAEQQAKMLDSISDQEDLKMLEDVITNPAKAMKESKDLEKAFFAGNKEALEKQIYAEEGLEKYPDFFKKALFERNERWLPVVEEFMQDDDTFFAVGLAHLIGERGLVQMLKEKEYKVELVEL